ncbi:MAG: alpha/beta hydrolase [Candidatus Hodarchaeota archaeon]
MPNIIYIHGLGSSGQGFKAQLLRKVLPGCLTPDFKKYSDTTSHKKLLEERMAQLISILREKKSWVIISSSFGGLMGALYTCQFPEKVMRLILLAPALAFPILNLTRFSPVNVPVIVFHGKFDKIIPIKQTRALAKQLFTNLTYNIVDDDHLLHSTVKRIDWHTIVKK